MNKPDHKDEAPILHSKSKPKEWKKIQIRRSRASETESSWKTPRSASPALKGDKGDDACQRRATLMESSKRRVEIYRLPWVVPHAPRARANESSEIEITKVLEIETRSSQIVSLRVKCARVPPAPAAPRILQRAGAENDEKRCKEIKRERSSGRLKRRMIGMQIAIDCYVFITYRATILANSTSAV